MTTEQQTTGIKVYDSGNRKAFGIEVMDEYQQAWNYDTKRLGVVNFRGDFLHTFPLNGWRMRNLAEAVYGERKASRFQEPGTAVIVEVAILKDLPGFDQFAMDMLEDINTITGVVIVQVAVYEASYGAHVVILPAK